MPAKDAEIPTDDERSSIERFIEAYDQAWVDARDTSRNIEDDGFHPSILGGYTGKCGRRNVYLLRSVEKRGFIDPRIQRVFGNGHGVHDRIQKLLHTMGIDFKDETEVKTDKFGPPISGHADGEAQWEGEGILIEIKSCSDEVFVNRLKWKKPKDEHFDQCNIYALVLGYKKIWIIYENKNTQETKIFERKVSPEKAMKIIDKWYAEWLCHQDGELPKRPYKIGSPTCAGCDVAYHCLPDNEIGVDIKPYTDKVKKIRKEEDEGSEEE